MSFSTSTSSKRKGDEHTAYTPVGVWHTLPFISVVVESNEFKSKSESASKSSWLISDLGIYVAREPKNANFEKCNHKNLST